MQIILNAWAAFGAEKLGWAAGSVTNFHCIAGALMAADQRTFIHNDSVFLSYKNFSFWRKALRWHHVVSSHAVVSVVSEYFWTTVGCTSTRHFPQITWVWVEPNRLVNQNAVGTRCKLIIQVTPLSPLPQLFLLVYMNSIVLRISYCSWAKILTSRTVITWWFSCIFTNSLKWEKLKEKNVHVKFKKPFQKIVFSNFRWFFAVHISKLKLSRSFFLGIISYRLPAIFLITPSFNSFLNRRRKKKFKLCRNFVNRPLAKYP